MLDETMIKMLLEGIRDTCYMTIVSTVFGYVVGLPLGIALTLTDEGGIAPNRTVYQILDVIINITRSIPFLILLILVMPLTKAIVGKTYGSTATIVLGTVLGYSAMAGVIGGGGLGDIAIRYGYYRYDTGVMLVTLVFIVAIVQLLQGLGNLAARKIDHRRQS